MAELRALAVDSLRRSIKFKAAASILESQWERAEVFPSAANRDLLITRQQRDLLALLSPKAGA
jgi:hypothetical protein